MVVLSIFSQIQITCEETIREFICLYVPQSSILFVSVADDDEATCNVSRGWCEVNKPAVKVVCGGLPHLLKR